jgi:hypothetical protein
VKHAIDISEDNVKVASIAGALFNNKDNKKVIKISISTTLNKSNLKLLGKKLIVKFQDINIPYYQSYCCAATKFLKFLSYYIAFLKFICNKDKPGCNYMEFNLYYALCDTVTLTHPLCAICH